MTRALPSKMHNKIDNTLKDRTNHNLQVQNKAHQLFNMSVSKSIRITHKKCFQEALSDEKTTTTTFAYILWYKTLHGVHKLQML